MKGLNIDVHIMLMSFLPTSDLSSLLQTCRHLHDAGIPSLCLHAGNRPIDNARHALSFRDFLRIGAPESRDLLVQGLWFRLPERSQFDGSTGTSQRPQEWTAVLTILYNCRALRRLRIDTWDDRIDPIKVLNPVFTSLKCLEDLSIALTPEVVQELQRVSLNGLRRLSVRWPRESELSLALRRNVLLTLRPLADTLVELNNVIPRYLRAPFSLVEKLGLAMDRSETLIRDAVHTFPNVTHLTLYSEHHQRCHWDNNAGRQEDVAFRNENKSRWSLNYSDAWPSLTAVWAEDLCGAYCLGIVHSVRAISLPLTLDSRFHMLPTIVAETRPSSLELRVDLDDPRICTGILDRLRMPDWRWLEDPVNASLSHLVLLLEGLDRAPVHASYRTEARLILVRCLYLIASLARWKVVLALTHAPLAGWVRLCPRRSLSHLSAAEIPWPSRCRGHRC